MPDNAHIVMIAVVAAALPLAVASAAIDPLAQYQWNHRVIVALASSPSDPNLVAQRRIFEAMRTGAGDRDLVLLEATDDTPVGAALRRRFGGGTGFRSVLIGKDGGAKAYSERPMTAQGVFALETRIVALLQAAQRVRRARVCRSQRAHSAKCGDTRPVLNQRGAASLRGSPDWRPVQLQCGTVYAAFAFARARRSSAKIMELAGLGRPKR